MSDCAINPITGRAIKKTGATYKKLKKQTEVLESKVEAKNVKKEYDEKKKASTTLQSAIKRKLTKKPEPPKPTKKYGFEDLPSDVKNLITDKVIISEDGKAKHSMDIFNWKYSYKKKHKDLFTFTGDGDNFGNRNIYWDKLISYLKDKIKKEEHDLIIKMQKYIIKRHRAERPNERYFGNSLKERLEVNAVPYDSTERAYRLYGMDEEELKRWGGVYNCPLMCMSFNTPIFKRKKRTKTMVDRFETEVQVWLRGDDLYNLKDVLEFSERKESSLKEGRTALLPDGYVFEWFNYDEMEKPKNEMYNAFLFDNENYPIDKPKVCRAINPPSNDKIFGDIVKRGIGYFPNFRMITPTKKQVDKYFEKYESIIDEGGLANIDVDNEPIIL